MLENWLRQVVVLRKFQPAKDCSQVSEGEDLDVCIRFTPGCREREEGATW